MASQREQRQSEARRGAAWFSALDTSAKWDLGDALVLGDFDWRDWGFTSPPSSAFLNGADSARMLWEVVQ